MAITFGLLGFFLPFLLSVFVVERSDDIEFLGALLIGAMWASNTLVAYSEVQSAGLQNTRSVGAAVSAGVVADLMSLTVLAFATATAVIEIEPDDLSFGADIAERLVPEGVQPTTPDPALPLWIGLPLLVFVCLWVLPRVANWFFVRVGRYPSSALRVHLGADGAGCHGRPAGWHGGPDRRVPRRARTESAHPRARSVDGTAGLRRDHAVHPGVPDLDRAQHRSGRARRRRRRSVLACCSPPSCSSARPPPP